MSKEIAGERPGGSGMARSRDKVQQEGFWDEEVKKPAHDQVVLWVDNNADLVLRKAFPEVFDRGWIEADVIWGMSDAERRCALEVAQDFMASTPRPDPRVERTTWECVLREERIGPLHYARSIGFADLIISGQRPVIHADWVAAREAGRPPQVEMRVGWIPLGHGHGVLVEAKPELPTRGELIRQLRHYQTVFGGPMVVVSPDDSYASLLVAQGIRFVQCPQMLS